MRWKSSDFVVIVFSNIVKKKDTIFDIYHEKEIHLVKVSVIFSDTVNIINF